MAYVSVNPATGEEVARRPYMEPDEVEEVLAAAAEGFAAYRTTPVAERARLLHGVADLLEGEQPDLARIMTTEMGKPFAQAKAEVSKCALAFRFYAEHGPAFLAETEVASAATRSAVRWEPLGPVLAVMPWNFPLWQVVRFAAPALLAGNVGLLKHASNVGETAAAFEDLLRRAGLPGGAFTNLYIGSGSVADVIADPRVAAVTLTGSEAAGRSVGRAAGEHLKKCVLELGGSDPFVVLASADLARAVRTGVQARVQNNGQSCIAAKRFIVVESVADEFTERFTATMAGLTVGDPFDPATDVGPLNSERQRVEVAGQVDDAVAQGAGLGCGGTVPDGPGWYYPPTVLTGITPAMDVYEQEVFGPVAMVERAADMDEALALANRTSFGLGSSVWTEDEEERDFFIAGLAAGMVFVNAMVASTPELPFGGIKTSGFGRELSDLGMKEFCNAKSVWVA
jgi:succinate-semialdehyde dehydrogenase/glutarate-semialdehyde dehydrogenase